jgi:hypothetical protein
MKQFKLREDLPESFTVTKQLPGVGMMMFNSEKVQPEDYHKWSKMGFADLFVEYVVEPIANQLVEKVVEEVKEVIQRKRTPKK